MPSSLPCNWPDEGRAVLIAAQSGRALAAAARRAGLRPFVADLFGDADTRALAAGYRKVAGRFGRGVAARPLLDALDALAREAGDVVGIVLGSGFEAQPDLITTIAGRHCLLGCSTDAVRAVKEPMRFAALLESLGIPHPAIRLEPQPDAEGWIAKRAGACGGAHIRRASSARLPRGFYLQRRVNGTPHSFAFLADGRKASVIAATRQWTSPSPRAPFRFAGAVEPAAIAPAMRAAAEQALGGIVAATGLCGLASADGLIDGEAWWLLEINPRPGATLDILDRREIPLLCAHIEACRGRLCLPAQPPGAAASEILYADRSIGSVPDGLWPSYVRDRPEAGSRVPAGAPLCTVAAEGRDAREAVMLLRARIDRVRAMVRTGMPCHATAATAPERQRARRSSHRGAGGRRDEASSGGFAGG